MIVVIDNYDSFTYNLVHYIGEHEKDIQVIRNDEMSAKEVLNLNPKKIIISPGPCTPSEAGISIALGAVAKSGTSVMTDVLSYAEPLKKKGFNYMDSPGYDPVSVTGQVASGSNVICFTTGRGSCFGFKPSPSLKIATNTNMYNNLEEDMDINAGSIMDGESDVTKIGTDIFDMIIDTASGKPSKSEINEYGEDEFNPWVIGGTV